MAATGGIALTGILIIDDEKLLAKGLRRNLNGEGFKLEVGYDGYGDPGLGLAIVRQALEGQ